MPVRTCGTVTADVGWWRWRRAEVAAGAAGQPRVRHQVGERRDVRQRGGCDRRDAGAQRGDVAFTVGVKAAGHEDDVSARDGIDPDRRAGETGVTDGADRHQFAAVRRE